MSKQPLTLKIVHFLVDMRQIVPPRMFGSPTIRDIAGAINAPHLHVAAACDRLERAAIVQTVEGAGRPIKLHPRWRDAMPAFVRKIAQGEAA